MGIWAADPIEELSESEWKYDTVADQSDSFIPEDSNAGRRELSESTCGRGSSHGTRWECPTLPHDVWAFIS